MIKQVSDKQILKENTIDKKTIQSYINIDSKEGKELIKEHNIKIDPDMKEL